MISRPGRRGLDPSLPVPGRGANVAPGVLVVLLSSGVEPRVGDPRSLPIMSPQIKGYVMGHSGQIVTVFIPSDDVSENFLDTQVTITWDEPRVQSRDVPDD
jgi:hypothetical protein